MIYFSNYNDSNTFTFHNALHFSLQYSLTYGASTVFRLHHRKMKYHYFHLLVSLLKHCSSPSQRSLERQPQFSNRLLHIPNSLKSFFFLKDLQIGIYIYLQYITSSGRALHSKLNFTNTLLSIIVSCKPLRRLICLTRLPTYRQTIKISAQSSIYLLRYKTSKLLPTRLSLFRKCNF